MKFQNEKKELWRYASKNLTAPVRGTNKQPPLPHRLPHQRLPQPGEHLQALHPPTQNPSTGCYEASCECTISTSISMRPQVSTPPPPYSSVAELDCSTAQDHHHLMFRPHQQITGGEMETSLSTTESDASYGRRQSPSNDGYSYVSSGDIMHEKLNESSSGSSSTYRSTRDLPKKFERGVTAQRRMPTRNSTQATATAASATTATLSFAANTAKFLWHCCGVGSTNSVVATTTSANNNNNTSCTKQNYENSKKADPTLSTSSANCNSQPELYFNALMKPLKASQITSLLKAVKSRHDQVQIMPVSAATGSSTRHSSMTTYQTNCILMRRAEIFGEEPYVIVCRLFLWRDLKNSSQLKRLPVCPNDRDPVYVCCNPLHWSRIIEPESAPPPYPSQRMDRNEGLPFHNYGNSTTFESTDGDGISSIRKANSDIYDRISESVTTDGEESRCSPNWCEVAYWELAQRVGERYPAETPTINIFSEKPYNSASGHIEGMCLKDLIETRTTPSPTDVQYTRQKIGLGVTLSQESDGVWLYNRSTVPIFVFSPTLAASFSRVCRVEPGDCLRAFDKYRAQSLVYSDQFPGVQTGPFDKFSMCISFGKGWGSTYKRPDVNCCPCWLEVLFRPQR